MAAAMESARERGAVISPCSPALRAIYRRFSYELVRDYMTCACPPSC